LSHIEKFAGLLPIGAAISIGEINGIAENAMDVPVYIVHGSLDSPNTRFYPLLQAMEDNGACVESNLLQGVGHTIDFANQVEILTEGYEFLQENACTTTSIGEELKDNSSILPYTILKQGQTLNLDLKDDEKWEVYSIEGDLVQSGTQSQMVVEMTRGIYIIRSGQQSQRFTVF